MHKLSRKEKINLLLDIKAGKIDISSLHPPRVYIFYERIEKLCTFVMDGKIYTEEERVKFCERISNRNRAKDKIITMHVCRGCEPINEE